MRNNFFTYFLAGLFTILIMNSCALKHGIIEQKYMVNKPEVIITDKYVILKASSSLMHSAASIYKFKYDISINDKTLIFSGIDGMLLLGNSKDKELVKIKKFKGISPLDFTYFYLNPDGTKIKIEPKNEIKNVP